MDVAIHVVKFSRQTAGRDKFYRFVQYAACFLKWYLASRNARCSVIEKCRIIENNFSMVRRALRLGTSIELFHSVMMHTKLRDAVLRFSLVCSKLSLACYLLVDHLVWAAKLSLVAADASKLGRIAARLWLISLVAGLIRDVTEILRAVRTEVAKRREQEQRRVVNHTRDDEYSLTQQSLSLISRLTANRPLLVDCIKNVTDLFLPSAALGYVTASDGFQGIMGMISSYMSILTIWDPALKLSP